MGGWFAQGAEDILSRVKVHRELAGALKDKSIVIGTTRRTGKKRGPVYPVRDAAERIRRLAESNSVALLFGKEDRGLRNEEVAECQFMIKIPASPGNPSFNLAQAVLIIAYELFCTGRTGNPLPATIDSQENREG